MGAAGSTFNPSTAFDYALGVTYENQSDACIGTEEPIPDATLFAPIGPGNRNEREMHCATTGSS